MNVLAVYGRLYVDALVKALRAISRNLWTLILPVILGVLFVAAGIILGGLGLGIIGGMILALVRAAVFSAYLYFVGEVVSGSQVSLGELKRSFGTYFWSVINLFFIVWIAEFLLAAFLRGAQGAQLLAVLSAVAAIAFNAAPEVIYQRGTYGGIQTLQESWSFLKENWLPWFIPNAPLIVALVALTGAPAIMPPIPTLGLGLVLAPLAHVAMVFRGFLFKDLVGSSHRQRMFRYRNG